MPQAGFRVFGGVRGRGELDPVPQFAFSAARGGRGSELQQRHQEVSVEKMWLSSLCSTSFLDGPPLLLFFTHPPCSRFSPRLHFATFFAVFFGAGVETVGAGGSGWVMGGIKDTPSSGPPGEVVDGPPEGVVGELPGEAVGGWARS